MPPQDNLTFYFMKGTLMNPIRKSTLRDISRIAEILIFTKRMNYRFIFQDDNVSFGEMQVLPLAQEYFDEPRKLEQIWVYDDAFVKGMIHIDSFFQNEGIGSKLLNFAIEKFDVTYLYVLEKNESAIRFYRSHGFEMTRERAPEPGTAEFVVKMERKPADK